MPSRVDGDGRVLLVDDDDTVRRFFVRALTRAGFEVVEAGDGPAGMARIAEDLPSVVVLDNRMPGMSGLDVLREIREQERFKLLPCIILTAGGDSKHERDALALGATQFLTKPFSPKKLYALVARLTGAPDEAGIISE